MAKNHSTKPRCVRALAVAVLFLPMMLAGCLEVWNDEDEKPTLVDREALVDNEFVFMATDAGGEFSREVAWRLIPGTGNCCENYVSTAPDGTIYDFGGSYIKLSTDEGKTWDTIEPPVPYDPGVFASGEGAIANAPGGDVVGVGWAPYAGDQAWAQKYEADTDEWSYAPIPGHTPVWDRQWVVALPGPFTIDGDVVEYITLARGGTGYKEALLLSKDGLNYEQIDPAELQTLQGALNTLEAFDAGSDPERDWLQPLQYTRIASVGNSLGLHMNLLQETAEPADYLQENIPEDGDDRSISDPLISCRATLSEHGEWNCLDAWNATVPGDALVMDSAGSLHAIDANQTGFVYNISHDGGRTWDGVTYDLPNNMTILEWDFKAYSSLDQTIVAIYAGTDNGTGQPMAIRYHGIDARPQLEEVLWIGDGEAAAGTGGASNRETMRYDFMSVGFLPDGRIVLSVADGSYATPILAVEL